MKIVKVPFDTMNQIYLLLEEMPSKVSRQALNTLDQQMVVTIEDAPEPPPQAGKRVRRGAA